MTTPLPSFVSSALCTALSVALLPAQGQGPFEAERLARLVRTLEAEAEADRHAGVSFVLVHRGVTVAEGAFGSADVASGRPFASDTIVRIFSMSKPITAIAALTAVERGELRLDQPIGDVVPELRELSVFTGGTADAPELAPPARAVTVRMLLNHTAGFSYDFHRGSPVHELYRRAELWQAASSDDFLQRTAKLPLLFQPGETWHYSIADDVLGIVLERALGRSLAEIVRERVTGPLGMVDTDFDVAEASLPRLATLYRRGDDGTLVPVEAPFGAHAEPGRGFPSGGAGMFSTLHDYARFGRFLLGDGSLDGHRVLGRKTIEFARRDSLPAGQTAGRPGHGWNLFAAVATEPGASSDPFSPGTVYWNGAATTSFFADPEEELVAVLFTQHMPFDERRLIPQFRMLVYQALR